MQSKTSNSWFNFFFLFFISCQCTPHYFSFVGDCRHKICCSWKWQIKNTKICQLSATNKSWSSHFIDWRITINFLFSLHSVLSFWALAVGLSLSQSVSQSRRKKIHSTNNDDPLNLLFLFMRAWLSCTCSVTHSFTIKDMDHTIINHARYSSCWQHFFNDTHNNKYVIVARLRS